MNMAAFFVNPLAIKPRNRNISRRGILAYDERMQGQASIATKMQLDVTSVGNLCLDILLPITSYPVRQGKHQRLTSGARLELGGSLNALISASRIGAKVAHIAYVAAQNQDTHPSDRLLSEFVVDSAMRLGLDTTAMVSRQGTVIPTCAALSNPHGEHTFLASNELPEDDTAHDEQGAPDQMLKAVARSKALIVDGYALHSDRSLVWQTVRAALDSGSELWVDPQAATASLLQTEDDLFRFILDHAGGVSLTADEARLITNQKDPFDAIRVVAKEHCPSASTFLLKDGANGSYIAWKGEDGGFEFCSVPGFSIEFKDSIGAGDSFLGAFLAGRLVQNLSMQDSGLLANAMGAATCMNRGAGEFGVGTLADVLRLLGGTALAAKLRAFSSKAVV